MRFAEGGWRSSYPPKSNVVTVSFSRGTARQTTNKAAGYSDNDKLIDAPDWLAVRAGGAFLSTVLDLARWDAVLRTNSILSEASRARMWTPARLNSGTPSLYGFGWHLNRPGAR